MDKVDDCIIFLLAKAYQRAHSLFKRRLQPFGLTPIQQLVLEGVWMEEGQSAGELGKMVLLDGATLSGVLERLADGGWIVKQGDPEDKRVVRIFSTDQARQHRPDLAREREGANEEILRDLTLEERVLLRRLLRDVRG